SRAVAYRQRLRPRARHRKLQRAQQLGITRARSRCLIEVMAIRRAWDVCTLWAALDVEAFADDPPSRKVSFYVVAHEDDWQLFMNPSAFKDITGGAATTVFIHVTAGDDGMGTGTGGRKQPYYLAREN